MIPQIRKSGPTSSPLRRSPDPDEQRVAPERYTHDWLATLDRAAEPIAAAECHTAGESVTAAGSIDRGCTTDATPPTTDRTPRQPVQPVAYFGDPPAAASPTIPPRKPGEHPLAPAITRAHSSMEAIAKIQDYSATMVKRERIDGVLGEHQYMFIKVRHQPFSVYIYFLAPGDLKGQESIYIAGKNDGNLLAIPTGSRRG